ncbi:MAG TPA: hypothetical protein PKA06_12820 [Gemmatales bacterium]|nr:hypothetical protein [Gemmatales bacterium]
MKVHYLGLGLCLASLLLSSCQKEEKVIMPTATLQAPPPDADRSSGGSQANQDMDK